MCARRIGTAEFFEANPFCCFCGGTVLATTIEHAPPKVLFRNKYRLKGLEFAACERCNLGCSDLDNVAAFFCILSGAVFDPGLIDDYWERIAQGVRNNTPEVLDYIGTLDAPEVWDIGSGPEHLHKVGINKRVYVDWLNPWVAKQACALWYHHTRKTITETMCILVRWMEMEGILKEGIPESLIEVAPSHGALQMGKLNSSDQFAYRHNLNPTEGIGIIILGAHGSSVAYALIMGKDHMLERYRTRYRGDLFATSAQRGIELWSPYETGFIRADSQIEPS